MCLSIVLFCGKRNVIEIRTDEEKLKRQISKRFCIFKLERIQWIQCFEEKENYWPLA